MTKKAQRTGDKWYKLAKQQGYRARSAFKLVQLNRQFNFLSKAHVLIDLCAAPGGWSQVAVKQMPVESTIIAVDLLPIKPIHGVKAFQGDITTQKCRNEIKAELRGKHADVVLHDGAPNVGGGWDKDAFDQNSLVLHSLRLAVEFMHKGSTFVTKIFRSADYHALIYIFNQLFEKVQATKPAASRNESAEIFVVCLDYKAPDYVDPKLLNPAYAFKQVEEKPSEVNLFNQKHTQKRHRNGYDEDMGMSLRRVIDVKDFMVRPDPIRVLTEATELAFSEASRVFETSPLTTEEVKACCADLRLLNKGDFKMLLKWRLEMLKTHKEEIKQMRAEGHNMEGHEGHEVEEKEKEEKEKEKEVSTEQQLQEVREKVAMDKRRAERKERKKLAKERKRRLLGLDNTPIEGIGEQVFSLDGLGLTEKDGVGDVNLNEAEDPLALLQEEEPEEEQEEEDVDQEELLASQLDSMYENYQTRHAANEKRYLEALEKKKGLPAQKLRELNKLDELYQKEVEMSKEDMLRKAQEEEAEMEKEDSSDEENKEENEEENEEQSDDQSEQSEESEEDRQEVPDEVRRQRWFSDPMFAELEAKESEEEDDAAAIQAMKEKQRKSTKRELPLEERLRAYNEEEDAALLEEEKKVDGSQIPDGAYVPPILEVPKTDKEKRHEKRLKQMEKKRRKEEKEKKQDLEVVGGGFPQAVNHLTEEELAHQALIKAGMGRMEAEDANDKLEVVKESKEPKIGSEEHLEALSLGFLMSKHSTANDLIESSFNRYMFNDPSDLPQWFLDDEKKYNRPQLPMTKEVIERLRKQFNPEDRTIKKEREALGRKRRRMERMRQQQKAKIDSINNDEDMPDSAKLKAIQKLMKGSSLKHPGKTYVVGKKGVFAKRGRNVKLVDRRMKKDKRGEKRAMKRRGKGKK